MGLQIKEENITEEPLKKNKRKFKSSLVSDEIASDSCIDNENSTLKTGKSKKRHTTVYTESDSEINESQLNITVKKQLDSDLDKVPIDEQHVKKAKKKKKEKERMSLEQNIPEIDEADKELLEDENPIEGLAFMTTYFPVYNLE